MDIFPRLERNKLVPRLWLGLVIAIVIVVVGYKVFVHSEPFEFGTYFVASDARVTAVTGAPRKTELRLTRPFRFSFGDRSGSAAMTIRSLSDTGTFDVELTLEKRAGRWTVQRAYVYPPQGAAVTIVDSACPESCS
jgi:hypothetical protein